MKRIEFFSPADGDSVCIFKSTCPRFYFTLATILLLQSISFGQNSPFIFYEIIKDDSVMLFFNDRNRFVEKKCSDFIRYTRVDNVGNFNGYYQDLSNENTLLSKGHYVHGNKHGYFEIFYPNGKIQCKGNYLDNRPVGQWEYFYENGLPERIINITESDTLLMRFVDKKGNLKVIDGNGEFNGFVGGNSSPSNSIIATGKIENGKPDGKWTSTYFSNTIYCKEQFEHGKLVRGTFPNATLGGNKEYTHKSFLNTFFLNSYINSLENFRLEKCADSARYSPKKYSFDIQKFNSSLRKEIDNVIENDLRAGNARNYSFGDNYPIGDNYLIIQFSVNKEGKAEDIRLLTGWGHQFFNSISTGIRMQTTFPTNPKIMFFHLKLHFSGGGYYEYSFGFSRDRTFNF